MTIPLFGNGPTIVPNVDENPSIDEKPSEKSEKLLATLRQLFDAADADGSGKLSRIELGCLLKAFGCLVTFEFLLNQKSAILQSIIIFQAVTSWVL